MTRTDLLPTLPFFRSVPDLPSGNGSVLGRAAEISSRIGITVRLRGFFAWQENQMEPIFTGRNDVFAASDGKQPHLAKRVFPEPPRRLVHKIVLAKREFAKRVVPKPPSSGMGIK